MVEYKTFNFGVAGSIPARPTIIKEIHTGGIEVAGMYAKSYEGNSMRLIKVILLTFILFLLGLFFHDMLTGQSKVDQESISKAIKTVGEINP